MAQQANAGSFLLQDMSGGRPVIKVLASDNSQVQELIQQIKYVKTAVGQQTLTAMPQVLKTQKFLTTKNLPIGAMTTQGVQKMSDVQATMRNFGGAGTTVYKTVPTPQRKIAVPLTTTSSGAAVQFKHRMSPTKVYHTSPPILDHSSNRKRMDVSMDSSDLVPELKRRKTEKSEKGLRHFSNKVCEKVRKKKATTYNEVADELVEEYTTQNPEKYDQKNIRRRVYDALNVLMAMGIISKQKKEIKWIGLPSNSVQECIQLEQEKRKKVQGIAEKKKYLLELITNLISFRNLVERNREYEQTYGRPPATSCIELPFIVVKTKKETVIDCSISQDKREYLFNFSDKFELHDDSEVLKQMGMLMGLDDGTCDSAALEKLMHLVPSNLQDYVKQIAKSDLNKIGAGPSVLGDDLIDTTMLDEVNSHQSSSPALEDFSDDDTDSELSDLCEG